jgi:hypothetical protein
MLRTEKVGPPVMFLAFIRELLGLNLGRDIGSSDGGFSYFVQSLQVNAEAVFGLCHDHFLPDPIQFIIHQPSYQSTFIV